MQRPFVNWARVTDYRCVKSVDVQLTPLHAFIGPNDSGKSTLLQGIGSGSSILWIDALNASVAGGVFGVGRYPLRTISNEIDPVAVTAAVDRRLLRLDPDELRAEHHLLPHGYPLWFANDRGRGLASLYDALLGRDRAAFIAIEDRFRLLFPTVKSLQLRNTPQQTKTIGLTLVDGADIASYQMSEGMLYWLAFAVIEHIAPAGILAIEEPENGLHPSRIAEVMRVLRELSQRTQVLIATHSPLVINELTADEVTLVTRDQARGTICTPLARTKNFAERSKLYSLGELWLSYADGNFEEALVDGFAATG